MAATFVFYMESAFLFDRVKNEHENAFIGTCTTDRKVDPNFNLPLECNDWPTDNISVEAQHRGRSIGNRWH